MVDTKDDFYFLKELGFEKNKDSFEYRNKDNFIRIEKNEEDKSFSFVLGKGETGFPLSVLIKYFNTDDLRYGWLKLKTKEDKERFDREEQIIKESSLNKMDYYELMIRRIIEDAHFFDEEVYIETLEFISHISLMEYGKRSPKFIVSPYKEGHLGILGEYRGFSHGDHEVRNRIIGLKKLDNGNLLMDYEENDRYYSIYKKFRMVIREPESVSFSFTRFSIGKFRKISIYEMKRINGKEVYCFRDSYEPIDQKALRCFGSDSRYNKTELETQLHRKSIDFTCC